MSHPTRRQFGIGLFAIGAPAVVRTPAFAQSAPDDVSLPPGFPAQDPALVREVVGASHSNLARVRELVEAQPALAKASWDWGFGDWETALGAASHTGQREIAELLLAHGARPTLFSAAMLGQLDVVRAFIEATPGVQRTHGPHSLTLMTHARAGGPPAAAVVKYLASVGGADEAPQAAPIEATVRDSLLGLYAYGPAGLGTLEVSVDREMLWLTPSGGSRRRLVHVGDRSFFPVGAPAVRISITHEDHRSMRLTIIDGPVRLVATRRG